jgi:hypothetical protein
VAPFGFGYVGSVRGHEGQRVALLRRGLVVLDYGAVGDARRLGLIAVFGASRALPNLLVSPLTPRLSFLSRSYLVTGLDA